MKDGTKLALLAVAAGGLYWWSQRKTSTTPTKQGVVLPPPPNPLDTANIKLCSSPGQLTLAEDEALIEQIARPLYRQVVEQLGHPPGPGDELEQVFGAVADLMTDRCDVPTVKSGRKARALARAAWMRETGGGG
jgi:hypothetical protein